ncbi:MAG: serine/threonine protein kinase, partial [Actinomycetota bacterium]
MSDRAGTPERGGPPDRGAMPVHGGVVLNDRYEMQQRIGRGGMAEVYLARDVLLDRLVAIKVLFPEYATDPAFVERFRREAQSA